MSLEVVYACVHSDRGVLGEVWKSGFGDVEVAVDVDVERVQPLVCGDVFELFLYVLRGMVEDESVEGLVMFDVLLDERLAGFFRLEVEGETKVVAVGRSLF